MEAIGVLNGTVKHYDWGGYAFIPSLLGINNDEKRPYAEYWMGVHTQAECLVNQSDGSVRLLRDYFSSMSPTALGEYVIRRFGNLPYLLKTLDVRDMLSIQVHPSKQTAEEGFAEENKRGIPLDSPLRNYKDDNHKPELAVAVSDFWLLHGFKPENELKSTLESVPELKAFFPEFEKNRYQGLYRTLMEMPQATVNLTLQPLLDRIIPLYNQNKLSKDSPDYWAARAAITFNNTNDKLDRGIFSIYLFNLVYLKRGEAIFQDAGVPHAYLEGQNVEIMANSDNVLRGGLTTKSVDVPELLRNVVCEPTYPKILTGEGSGPELIYKTPAPDFELSSFSLKAGETIELHPAGAEIYLLIEGELEMGDENNQLVLKKGNPSALVLPGHVLRIKARQGSWLFRASVPHPHVDN